MSACPACASPLPLTARFCASCGAANPAVSSANDLEETRLDAGFRQTVRHAGSGAGRSQPSSASAGRFDPGDVLVERYRIVGLLGKGGMGEVYRADDLKLGQPVAIKFLPPAFSANPGILARFHNEVRLARQITHRNICRVHDIGEVDGEPYLTMELVGGENLASLLRRIGRLPAERGIQIARQLCAGLSAAHELGVLHRDLKPENVMIDGRGIARITDFGLAAIGSELPRGDVRSGTPAYMAPEQIEGREVTVRSDLYSLGLVLYEMFTGALAFQPAGTLAELAEQRREAVITHPSQVIAELDPAVERVILRCLDPVPGQRPSSALAVAASLPGGDPLAAALAAGETPSPEMVAAAGPREGLKPAVAWGLMAALVLAALGSAALARRRDVLSFVPMERPPEAAIEKARAALAALGAGAPPADYAFGFQGDDSPLQWLKEHVPGRSRWEELRDGRFGAVSFWYRQSPQALDPDNIAGMVHEDEPDPFAVSGGVRIRLDEGGRLEAFDRVPDQVRDPAAPAPAEFDWKTAFDLAGLDFARFTPIDPVWLPPVAADRRLAWQGALPAGVDVPLRVEAASENGRPVWFELVYPWSRPGRMAPPEPAAAQRLALDVNIATLVVALACAAWLARKNLVSGRGDRRGAFRLGSWLVGSMVLCWALNANHLPSAAAEWSSFVQGTALALFIGALVWTLYIALEPSVRRHWPGTLVGWTRLLSGRWRDPIVGRDLLVGSCAAALLALAREISELLSEGLGRDRQPVIHALLPLAGPRAFLAWPLAQQVSAFLMPMLILLMLVGFRALLKRERTAIVAVAAVFIPLIGILSMGDTPAPIAFSVAAVLAVSFLFLLVRFGLLALVAMGYVATLLDEFPLTLDSSRWWFGGSAALLGLVFAFGVLGLRASLAGRRTPGEA